MRAGILMAILAAALLAAPAAGMINPPRPEAAPPDVDINAYFAEFNAYPGPKDQDVYDYVTAEFNAVPPNYHPLFDVMDDHRRRPPGDTQDVVIPPAPEPRWAHTAAPELVPGPAPGWAPAAPVGPDAEADPQVVWVSPVQASLTWLWGVVLFVAWVTFLVAGVVRDVRMARSVDEANVPVIS